MLYLKDLPQIEHWTSDLPIRLKYFHTNERAKMEEKDLFGLGLSLKTHKVSQVMKYGMNSSKNPMNGFQVVFKA